MRNTIFFTVLLFIVSATANAQPVKKDFLHGKWVYEDKSTNTTTTIIFSNTDDVQMIYSSGASMNLKYTIEGRNLMLHNAIAVNNEVKSPYNFIIKPQGVNHFVMFMKPYFSETLDDYDFSRKELNRGEWTKPERMLFKKEKG